MKRLLAVLMLVSSSAYAGDDVECTKKHSDAQVHCNFNKTETIVRVSVNGGECADFTTHRIVPEGYHWIVPNVKSCHYIARLTLYTKDGKIYTFAPL